MNTFSIGETIRFGWEAFKKQPWLFVGATLVVSILGGLVSGITDELYEAGLHFIGFPIDMVVSTLIGLGTTAFYLKAHEAPESVGLKALWHPQNFWFYLFTSAIAGLIVVAGLILLIIPGVIALLAFGFATYIVVDRKLSPIEALKESARITKGHRWQLLGFMLTLLALNILGFFALLVGLLVTIPVSGLAFVHAYRTLEHRASEVTTL